MKYGFIGCGNMGSALASALSKSGNEILLSDHTESKALQLAEKLNCKASQNADIANECDIIFLAVKPQSLEKTVGEIKSIISDRKPVIVTMAAGVKLEKIESLAGCNLPVIRIMPNTPVAVGRGVVLYCYNNLVDESTLSDFIKDLSFAGAFEKLPESFMDIGCAVSGCGPAYMYMFVDAIANSAEKNGLDREQAVKLAALTMSGAAEMVLQSDKTPEELKIAVCSPGGSTIEGVKVLESESFKEITENAIDAAYNRNVELGK